MKRISSFVIFLFLFLPPAFAEPGAATKLLKEASAHAAKENKNIFVIFHGSWCGWCYTMDSAINDPESKFFLISIISSRPWLQKNRKRKNNWNIPAHWS